MLSWLDRPAHLIAPALKGDLLDYVWRARAESQVPIVVDPPDGEIQ
jgi:hypothetical protein